MSDPESPKAPGTLTVERHGDGVFLVLNHQTHSEPLARFVSNTAPAKFINALALAKASAHAMGQSGI